MPNLAQFAPSYALTRPYPRPKLVLFSAIISGVILATLFTFASVATTAYQFRSVYTPDPNGTESDIKWFQRNPFKWLGSIETTCQDTVLVAGGRYMTTNRGFVYTLDAASSKEKPVAQAAYHNSNLQDCDVALISIYLSRAAITRDPGTAWTWGNTVASAVIACNIENTAGVTNVNLTIELPMEAERSRITTSFLTQNGTGHQSMWYGARLTSEWYRQVATAMAILTPPANLGNSWADGVIKLRRNPNVKDYRSLDFFYVGYQQPIQEGGLAWQNDSVLTASDWLNGTTGLPRTTYSVDAFAKSFYSLLATEFGVASDANALRTAQGAKYLASINDPVSLNASKHCYTDDKLFYCRAGNVSVPIDQSANFTTEKPTLYAQYLCSVPQQKSSFVIFYTVLLADIVFLRACWSLFGLVASSMLERRDQTSNHCAGCVAATPGSRPIGSPDPSTTSPINRSRSYRAPHHDRRPSSTVSQPLLNDAIVLQMEQMRDDSSPPPRLLTPI